MLYGAILSSTFEGTKAKLIELNGLAEVDKISKLLTQLKIQGRDVIIP